MTPASYTLKSISGPVLLIVAAYLYGQSVGRRDNRRRRAGLGALTSNSDLDKFRFVFRKKQDGVKLSVYDGKKLVGVVGAITEGNCYPEGPLEKYRKHANVVSAEILPEYRGKKLYQEMLLRFRQHAKEELGCTGLKSAGFQRSTMATRAWEKLNPRVEIASDGWRNDFYLDGLPTKGRIQRAGGSAIRNKDGSLRVNVGDVVRLSKDTPHPDGSLPKLFGPMIGVVVKVYPDVGSGSGKKKTGKVKVRWASGSEATHDGHLVYTVESIKARGLAALPTKGRIPVATAKRALKKLPRKAQACRGMTPAALREGMEIEREHRDITKGRVGQTAKIAAAHICERPDYYKRIKRFVEK